MGHVRHVWVMDESRHAPPSAGLVIAWHRFPHRWAALVVYVDERADGRPVVQVWVPESRLRPVASNPRTGRPVLLADGEPY